MMGITSASRHLGQSIPDDRVRDDGAAGKFDREGEFEH
jgi:hypothetical protein